MLPFILFLCALLGFFVTFKTTSWLIKYLRKIQLTVKDQHKEDKPLVPISGGISVLAGLMAGLMLFLFFRTFTSITNGTLVSDFSLILLLSSIITIFTITFVGFVDDLLIHKSRDFSGGLKQWQKPLLTLVAAVPLMVAKAGNSVMLVPFIGHVDFGLFYPLLLVPLGVVGAANMVNLLAGFNGLETGMGIVAMLSLGLYAYANERYVGALIALITFAALLAFYFYNKTPAKIFPGDSLTYLLGATLATVAIVGNLEKAALIISIPFIIELFLKLRGKFQKTTVGYYKDGKVHSHYQKIYSIPHFLTRTGKYTEKQVVYSMILLQSVFSLLIWFV